MKKLIYILLLMLPFIVNGQSWQGTGTPATQRKVVGSDTLRRFSLGAYGYDYWMSDWQVNSLFDKSAFKFNFTVPSDTLVKASVSGWDQVLRELGNVIIDNGTYYMTYTGHINPYVGNQVYVGMAYSTNGITWTKSGVDGKLNLPRSSEDPFMIKVGSTFYLYVEDKEDVPFRGIRLYTSTNLTAWTDRGRVLDKGTPNTVWDGIDVSSPTVLYENGTFYLFYEGRKGGQAGAMGLATSTDGITFTKNVNNPLLAGTHLNGVLKWCSYTVPDDIHKVGDYYYVSYHGWDGFIYRPALALSKNLINWRDYSQTFISQANGIANDMLYYKQNGEWLSNYLDSNRVSIVRGVLTEKNDYSVASKPIITTANVTTIAGTSDLHAVTFKQLKDSVVSVPVAKITGILPISKGGSGKSTGSLSLFALDQDSIYGRKYFQSSITIGGTNGLNNINLRIGGSITGSASASQALFNAPTVQADVTGIAYYNRIEANTAASSAPSTIIGYNFKTNTIGAGSSTGSLMGVRVENSTFGTAFYALKSEVNTRTGAWNLYANGTAPNYLNGNLLINSTADNGQKLQVTGRYRVSQYLTGVAGTDSIVVHDNTSKEPKLISPTYYAPVASPAFSGIPTVPTAAPGTNTTQAASTAFVQAAVTAVTPTASNGITKVSSDFQLGGTLSAGTILDLSSFSLNIQRGTGTAGRLQIVPTGSSLGVATNTAFGKNISFNSGAGKILIYDTDNNIGIEAAGNYEANYTSKSYTSRRFVDSASRSWPETGKNANATLTSSETSVEMANGGFTITLPSAAIGKIYVIKGAQAGSASSVPTQIASSGSLEHQTAGVNLQVYEGESLVLQSTGAGAYNIIAKYSPIPGFANYTASGTGAATTISIPHGLKNISGISPVLVQPLNAASAGIQYSTIDATNVNVMYTIAPALGTNNLNYSILIKP